MISFFIKIFLLRCMHLNVHRLRGLLNMENEILQWEILKKKGYPKTAFLI
jgi:hypothetical protein